MGLQLRLRKDESIGCAAANEDWKSVTYRVSVKYWLLFFDTFCAFLHAHGYKNVLNGRGFSFLCKYFNLGFTLNCSTVVLQSLTVNASWVRRFWLHNTFCIFRVQKYKISLTLYTFYTFFLQNMFILTWIRPKWHLKSAISVKKETVLGLSLSLDVLIYIIRYSKPKSEDWRFNLSV